MESVTFRRPVTCGLKLRLMFSGIGVLVGLCVFPVFSFHYQNYNAGLWGLASGLCASLAFGVTIAHIKKCFDSNPRVLRRFMLLGCFIQLIGFAGIVAYVVLGITINKKLIVYGPGYFLTVVWCFMTFKWGLGLLLYSRSYMYSLMDKEGSIINKSEKAYSHNYQTVEK